jgi:cytochrome P450
VTESAEQAPAYAAVPPPQCPAHQFGDGAARRLFGPEAESDPMGLYEKLRAEHGAVAPVRVHGDVPAWLVLGYYENLAVVRNPSRFSRDSRRWRELQEGRVAADSPLGPVITWQPMCAFADGEEHKRLRRAVTESLSRFEGRGIRRHVTRSVHQLVNEFCRDGRADLVEQFARHLPMLVMTQLLGMPDEYGPRLVAAARDMVTASETALESNAFIVAALRELVTSRRRTMGDDFPSWLLSHPAGLNDDEALEHLRLVLIAAYETTANLIANTLRMLLTDPRFRASLAVGNMTLPEAVEQTLWDEPPFMTVYGRWATSDTELGGQLIRSGDMLILGLAAGNADPAVRPDPSEPVHANGAHLAFSGGPHECPGQEIARTITATGIDALLMALPDLRLAGEEEHLNWTATLLSRQLIALPAEFTPRGLLPVPERAAAEVPMAPLTPQPPIQPPHTAAPTPSVRAGGRWWRSLLRWARRG